MGAAATPRLALSGVTKRFPGCLANDAVDLDVQPGEIHALLGENGAGKSTLVKIIYGVLAADSGTVAWEGQPVTIQDPNAARKLGIGMVFQHFSLFEALTVLENIALGLPGERDLGALAIRINEVAAAYGLPLDLKRDVHDLSVGERQRIEILRCLLQDPKLLIMDEPTSVLTPQEAETDPGEETAASLAGMMIGEAVSQAVPREKRDRGKVRLRVEGLDLLSPEPFGIDLHDVRLSLHEGEILGIAGVAGNGQIELQEALSGEVTITYPTAITIDGEPVGHEGPEVRRRRGLAFLPEERLGHGAVPGMSLGDNALLSGFGPKQLLAAGGVIREGATRNFAETVIERFDVRTSGVDAEARSLSGGNLQKFIIGREIEQQPRILIAAQPTWGVDAGAAAHIHQALFDLAGAGAAVLVISQDLDELLAITDRLAVLHQGHLSEALPTVEATAEQIGLLMAGSRAGSNVDSVDLASEPVTT